eukprot:Tamp_18495.p2 GENE.Tamp_18495~~Tamp_18495.p2  ORF type:complete len:145 (-),score=30.98 Tamp_18495:383-817(-)
MNRQMSNVVQVYTKKSHHGNGEEEVTRVKKVQYNKTPYNNFQKFLQQQSAAEHLRIRDPYKSPHDIAKEEKHQSKMLWVTQKDFRVLPTKANPPIEQIPPYINLTPWSGPPDSQFARMVKNQKELPPSEWIDEKGMRFNFKAKV